MKILFVDEDIAVLALRRAMEVMYPGHEFVLKRDVGSAKTIIFSQKFDVIVLDIWATSDETLVPGSSKNGGMQSGLVLANIIQQDSTCPNHDTPIILLTGLDPNHIHIVKAAESSYGDCFLQKPADPIKLFKLIETKAIKL